MDEGSSKAGSPDAGMHGIISSIIYMEKNAFFFG
jgi:hypothetical protein